MFYFVLFLFFVFLNSSIPAGGGALVGGGAVPVGYAGGSVVVTCCGKNESVGKCGPIDISLLAQISQSNHYLTFSTDFL